MNQVKAIVLRTAGTNCDKETVFALRLAGADTVDLIHINEFISGKASLAGYQIMAFPGGFSYGDDISAGKVYATQLKYKLAAGIRDFNAAGKLIIGICNGFQILVKLGLLPGDTGDSHRQSATLFLNDSGKFECRWIYLKTISKKCLWTKGLPKVIRLPIAHAEGKFIPGSKKQLAALEKNSQVVFRYADEKGGEKPSYPLNPNGSTAGIAGITNARGNVFGLMPHPERFILRHQYAAWSRAGKADAALFNDEFGIGLTIFKNAVDFARKQLKVD
jgi:phosphoribosylformylglycinamidine synthase subunit PurQ / glutaminase